MPLIFTIFQLFIYFSKKYVIFIRSIPSLSFCSIRHVRSIPFLHCHSIPSPMGCVPVNVRKQKTSQTVQKITSVRRHHRRSKTEITRLQMEINGQKIEFPIQVDFKHHLAIPSSRRAGTDERQRPTKGKQITHGRSPSFEKEIEKFKRAQATFKSYDYRMRTSSATHRVQSSIN